MTGLLDPLAEYELIVPENIPGTTINPDQIAEAASSFSTMASTTREKGSAVKATWSGLAVHYEAPESADLLAVMDPVETNSTVLSDKFDRVSTLLATLSDTVEPIKNRLIALKADAEAFVADVQNGVLVSVKAAEQAGSGAGYYGTATTPSSSTTSTYAGGTYVGGMTQSMTTTKTVAWHEDLATSSRNRTLIREVNEQVAKLDAAQADCVNGLRALSTDPWKVPEPYVPATEDALNQPGLELAWGPATRDIPCESSFGYGIASGIAGLYEGSGALVSFNVQTGQWFDGNLFVGSWRGMAMTGAGVILAANPSTWLQKMMPVDDPRPQWSQDFEAEALDTVLQAGKSIVGWGTWGEDPAQAAGLVAVNALTFFIPGGAVVGGLKSGSAAARTASFLGHTADIIVPGGRLITNSATGGLLHAGHGVQVLTATARHGLTAGISTARSMLAQSLHSVANQLPTVEVVPGASAVTPDGMITTPSQPRVELGAPGSGGDWLNRVAARVDGGSGSRGGSSLDSEAGDAGAADDGAGAGKGSPTRGAPVVHPGDGLTAEGRASGAERAPGADGNGGSGRPDTDSESPDRAGAAFPEKVSSPRPVMHMPADPLGPVAERIHNGTDPTSPGVEPTSKWDRALDYNSSVSDAEYGSAHDKHGTEEPVDLTDTALDANTVATVRDLNEPFGHDSHHVPLDQTSYDQRFKTDQLNGQGNYSDRDVPNMGAVRGSIVHYHSIADAVADYGSQLDRIGFGGGDFLGVKIDGKAAWFEERSLGVSALRKPYSSYNLNPNATLLSGWKVEVSRIAPGAGRDGGGIQLRIVDGVGRSRKGISVDALLELGILE